MIDLSRNIVVSGCTKGIGYAICEHFAQSGFHVAGCARNKDDIEKMQQLFENRFPSQQFFFTPCDISDKESVLRFGAEVSRTFPQIHILVNNAGVFIPGQIHNEDDGVLEKLLSTNVTGTYHLTRSIIGGMMQHKEGHVFNICSVASINAYPNGGSYCISKFALLGFSRQLREEMKNHGIKVTAILPGATHTDSWAGSGLPESRFIKADDIAKTIWAIYDLSSHSDVEEIIIRPQLGDI